MHLVIVLVLFVCCLIILYYLYQGPLFVPTLQTTVQQMVACAHITPGMKVVDLGSGDGRVVIAMAQAGAIAHGFEINPGLVWYSRYKIRRLRLTDKAQIETSDFWKRDLGDYDVITIFGINHVMNRLSEKLATELKPSAIVVSNAFHLPKLELQSQIGSLLIYKKPRPNVTVGTGGPPRGD